MASHQPVVVIVGQTASGKSSLAMQLAEQYNGAIIAADSRTIYKGMDIGTAKPSIAEQAAIPHYLLDVVTPAQSFTAADFKSQATAAIAEISRAGKLPIVVGGTGLYVDSLLYDFTFRPVDASKRVELEKLTVQELQARILAEGLDMPQNQQNPRHLVRVLESAGEPGQKNPLRTNTLVLGLDVDAEVLKARITERVKQMFADGLEGEVMTLVEQYGWQSPGLSAIGYQEFQAQAEGTQTPAETEQKIIQHTWQYARRQKTWFKRNPDIQWCTSVEHALTKAEAFLTTKGVHMNNRLLQ